MIVVPCFPYIAKAIAPGVRCSVHEEERGEPSVTRLEFPVRKRQPLLLEMRNSLRA